MADSNTTGRDTLTRARRERRRLLLGASASGSLMMTLPTRRLFAGTKKKNHGSVWCSFCTAKKKNVKISNTPITTSCGDSPTTWQSYVGSTNNNDCPVGWDTWNFETYFPRPTGYSWYLSGHKQSSTTHPTFGQCIYGFVTYKNNAGTTIGSTYAQQAACSYINAYYYNCGGTSFYNNKQCSDVQTDFHNNSPNNLITCANKWSAYNTD